MSNVLTHPRAIAAERQQFSKKVMMDLRKQTLKEQIAVHDLKFLDLPPSKERRVAMNIAFQVTRRDIINMSTAILHPHDTYSKFEGRFQAAYNFENGFFIQLKKPSGIDAKNYLEVVFGVATLPLEID